MSKTLRKSLKKFTRANSKSNVNLFTENSENLLESKIQQDQSQTFKKLIMEDLKKVSSSNQKIDEKIIQQIFDLVSHNQQNPEKFQDKIKKISFTQPFFIVKPTSIHDILSNKNKINKISQASQKLKNIVLQLRKNQQCLLPTNFQDNFMKINNQLEQVINTTTLQFQKTQNQNQIIFKSSDFSSKSIITELKNKFQRLDFIDLEIYDQKNQVVTLRGGKGEEQKKYKIKIKLSKQKFLQKHKQALKQVQCAVMKATSFKNIGLKNLEQYQNTFNKIKKQLDQLYDDVSKINEDNEHQKRFVNIDVVIVMDTTGSMSSYLQKAKQDSKNIISLFKNKNQNASLHFGLVFYKDHNKNYDGKQVHTVYQLTSNINHIQKAIQNQTASGGDDTPEAVHDGLYAAGIMNWRKDAKKFVILIADAPPHGKQYHSGSDNFIEKCPCDISILQISGLYKQKNIHLAFKAVSDLTQVNEVFKKHFSPQLYEYGTIQCAQKYSQQAADYLDKKIKSLERKKKIIQQKFKQMVKNITEEVASQVKNIIQYNQSNNTLVKLKNYSKSMIEMLNQLKNTKPLAHTQKALNQIMQIKCQLLKISQ